MTIDKKTIQVCDTYNIIVNELAYYWHVTFLRPPRPPPPSPDNSQTQYHYQYMAIVHSSTNDQ